MDGPQILHVVQLPARLCRLAFQGPQRHHVELFPDAIREVVVESSGRTPQYLAGDHGEAVAGVECGRGAVGGRQSWPSPAHLAAIGDVVMHQKGVVHHLDRNGYTEKILRVTAERASRR